MKSGLEKDYTEAIFGAMTDTVKKVFLLATVPVFGHFIGVNCHEAPDVIASVRASGFAGLSALGDNMNIAMMPLYWIGTMIVGFGHLLSGLWVAVFAYAALTLWLADEEWWRGAAIILIGQPLHSWYVLSIDDSSMSDADFALSGTLIACYLVLAVSAAVWFARQRSFDA